MDTKTLVKSYISNNISKVVSLVIFIVLTIMFKIFNVICVKYIFDFATSTTITNNGTMLFIFTMILTLSTIASIVCDIIRQSKSTSFGNDITYELRTTTFQTLMKSELYEKNKYTDDEISESIVEATKIIGNDYISGKIINLLYNAVFLVSILTTLLVFNSTYAFITILSLPIYYFIHRYLMKASSKREEEYSKYNKDHHDIILDNIKEFKIIKTRNGVEKEIDAYEKTLIDNKKILANNVNVKHSINKFMPALFTTISLFILFLSTSYSFYENLSEINEWILQEIGFIVGCAILTPNVFKLFKNVLDLYYINLNPDAACEKIDKILTLRSERRTENVPSLEEIQSLKFNSVSFDYIPYGLGDKVNLDKIEFEIKKGEKLGIIGLPGSGKSTIADLITKVIRPRQGNVLINNCDINKVNTNYLRSIVTYVPEEYHLLNTSIEKNVTYPLSLDEYKYNDALNKCKLKDLIFSLPQRDETNARSISLSNADIQKISLANAFYKESPIMILDDATSKLDSVTEDEIMTEFFKLKNKISIVISNRINNIAKCDKVLIISNGKTVEYGSVEELMSKRNSTFSKMVTDANLNKKIV